jgi:preprotein translocase subunit SecG
LPGRCSELLNTVLTVFHILFAIGLTVAVISQSGKSAGLSGTISGASEQVFGKKKGMDEILNRVSTVLAILFVMSSLLISYLEFHA